MPKYTKTLTIEAERIVEIRFIAQTKIYEIKTESDVILSIQEDKFMSECYQPGGYVVMDENWSFMNDLEGWEEDASNN